MKKVLIVGGALNPPTTAHEALIGACLELPGYDEVHVMPSGSRRDKTIETSDEDRLAMLGLMRTETFHDNPRLIIDEFELRLPRPTNTYQTDQQLRAHHPDWSLTYALGRDAYQSMPTGAWEHGTELQRRLALLVFGSGPGPRITAPNVTQLAIPAEFGDVSSTEVRNRAARGLDISNIVSHAVAIFIKERGLYRSAPQPTR